MKLLNLQRRMARAVMTPLTSSERMRTVAPDGRSMRAVANQIIKPNDRLTSFERLEIYNRQYWFRVLSAFAEDFPGLRAVLGRPPLRRDGQSVSDRLPVAILHPAQSRFAPGGLAAKTSALGRRAAESGRGYGAPGVGRY